MPRALARTRPVRPATARVTVAEVVRSERASDGFTRVVLAVDAADFTPMGADQWFRLLLPPDGPARGQDPALPLGEAEGWYSRWLAMPEDVRPAVRNYTVRCATRAGASWLLDVDFVVHRDRRTGAVEGLAASWALAASPGDRVGLLDQGVLFNPPAAPVRRTLLVADESGLPGVEAVARGLPAGSAATAVIEVACPGDRRDLTSEADLDVVWAVRGPAGAHGSIASHGSSASHGSHGSHGGHGPRAVGAAALDALDALVARGGVSEDDHVHATGVASLVLGARQRVEAAGVPREHVAFCAYWRPTRRPVRGPVRAR